MKKYLISVLGLGAGLGLLLALPAAAEKGKGPCADDVAKFCKDVKPGEGRVQACLKEHEKELSAVCAERRALRAEKRGKGGERMGRRGGRGGDACMRAYGDGFARGFGKGIRMRQGLGAKGMKAGKRAKQWGKLCAADARKLCGDVKPGEGRVRDCLLKNVKSLSGDCKARVEKIKERQEQKEKRS